MVGEFYGNVESFRVGVLACIKLWPLIVGRQIITAKGIYMARIE
jgi:hypothetical protein